MQAHLVPELALARVVTAGGPYRPGDDLSLAFTTPTVSRLVAHDAELRARCVPLEQALVPETIAVVITHCAEPYISGEILTLSFVDPRVARIHESLERQAKSVVPPSASETTRAEALPTERISQSAPAQWTSAKATQHGSGIAEPWYDDRSEQLTSAQKAEERPVPPTPSPASFDGKLATDEPSNATTRSETSPAPSTSSHFERKLEARNLGVSYSSNGADPTQIHAGEPMTFRADASIRLNPTSASTAPVSNEHRAPHDGQVSDARSEVADTDSHRDRLRPDAPANDRVTVRLEWKSERLRRFVQVVDKLFTIDRLGWYRHSLAMRLLIPDEIACGDTLANVEAMRHLHALRAAAVESLGKPLLAACMPGFSISSEWLDSIESPREARAIAGLRDALLPYADDGEAASERPSGEALYTTGTISRIELLAENATSVEAFLPLLIPTTAHDAALGLRLAEYRRLLIELFAQTARAGEPVRLQQMAQPNHSLDDRLWQLVGAAAEAFGGFAHA